MKNHQFIGREGILNKIKEVLSSQTPKQYNHRIALYGMGGVGKTQCALEYAYANRASYEKNLLLKDSNLGQYADVVRCLR
jgi:Cdc6-like AAA superfamily ATPase